MDRGWSGSHHPKQYARKLIAKLEYTYPPFLRGLNEIEYAFNDFNPGRGA